MGVVYASAVAAGVVYASAVAAGVVFLTISYLQYILYIMALQWPAYDL